MGGQLLGHFVTTYHIAACTRLALIHDISAAASPLLFDVQSDQRARQTTKKE
jgi:hypothetical protein